VKFLPCSSLSASLLIVHEYGLLTDIFLESVLLYVKKRGVLLWCYETVIIGVYLFEYSSQKCCVGRSWCGPRKKGLPAVKNGRLGSLVLGR
jgi:hypothetical protein